MIRSISRRGFLALSSAAAGTLVACGNRGTGGETSATNENTNQKYGYRFADAAEGAQLIVSNEDYLASFSQGDLDFRLQKKGGTLEEWKTFGAEQVRDFTAEEKSRVDATMARLEQLIAERKLALPDSEEIVFVKTTMHEEGDAGAYTHGTQIYIGEVVLDMLGSGIPEAERQGFHLFAHELFHCLTRSNPDFRSEMYSILGFEVQQDDYEFGPDVKEALIANPDVEHHNSSRDFTIAGQPRRCTVVFYATRPFESVGDMFFDLGDTGFVPVDDLNTIIPSAQIEDYWEVFGENTEYTIDPEEVLAENFALAIVFGRDRKYKTPRIIDEILTRLAE